MKFSRRELFTTGAKAGMLGFTDLAMPSIVRGLAILPKDPIVERVKIVVPVVKQEIVIEQVTIPEDPLPEWAAFDVPVVKQEVKIVNGVATWSSKRCGACCLSMAMAIWQKKGGRAPIDQYTLGSIAKQKGFDSDPTDGIHYGQLLKLAKNLGYKGSWATASKNGDVPPKPRLDFLFHMVKQPAPLIANIWRPFGEKIVFHSVVVAGFSPDLNWVLVLDPLVDNLGGRRVLPIEVFLNRWDVPMLDPESGNHYSCLGVIVR